MSPFSIRSTLMLVLLVGGTSSIYVFLGLNLIMVLIVLGLACLLYVPFAKRYGWGNEGRLTRHLSRPPFEDERCKSN
ncbi:cellobiose-specific phosphotransferase system component IIC [Bradyrhizobium sp. S3.2.6]